MGFIGVIYRNRSDPKASLSPKSTPTCVRACNLEPPEHPAQLVGSALGWRVSLPGSSAGLRHLSVLLTADICLRATANKCGQFQGLPESVQSFLLPELNFSIGWNVPLPFRPVVLNPPNSVTF